MHVLGPEPVAAQSAQHVQPVALQHFVVEVLLHALPPTTPPPGQVGAGVLLGHLTAHTQLLPPQSSVLQSHFVLPHCEDPPLAHQPHSPPCGQVPPQFEQFLALGQLAFSQSWLHVQPLKPQPGQ